MPQRGILPASAAPAAFPEKSIAVLPFENLSEEKANAFFTDGVQDEILTDLAKIADLKVISRTSVMQYKMESRAICAKSRQQLGVAHLVEGSVQRVSNRVRVNAQLIDARNDAHLWAQTYDRDLADVFAIQSEIAKAIADQLQAKLSPAEKNAIEQRPTNDVAAFDLYSRAKNLMLTTAFSAIAGKMFGRSHQICSIRPYRAILRSLLRSASSPTPMTNFTLWSRSHSERLARRSRGASGVQLRPEAGEVASRPRRASLFRVSRLRWSFDGTRTRAPDIAK